MFVASVLQADSYLSFVGVADNDFATARAEPMNSSASVIKGRGPLLIRKSLSISIVSHRQRAFCHAFPQDNFRII
jgi:hypothetical protein